MIKNCITIFLALFIVKAQLLKGQILVNNNVSLDNVIQELLGPDVVFYNATFSGSANQVGTFQNPNTGVMGLGAGVILGTGDVLNAAGPNNSSSASLGGGNSGASDPDLDALDGLTHNDAAILEFDFVATGTTMNFQYVFASEEYPEYSGAGGCGDVSDVFGFFLSGPGINGAFSNNAINVALIPGSNQFVSIANLNAGCDGLAVAGDEFCNFCEYYINNGDGFTEPFMSDAMYLQYDGYTVVLNATYEGLQCGETYHIKLALADVSDTAFDSAVFLKASGFGVSNQFLEPSFVNINPSNLLFTAEGCLDATFYMTPPSCDFAANTLYLSYGGTAVNGVDYELLPNQYVVDAFNNSLSIYPINDGNEEGNEYVEIIAYFFDQFGNYYADTLYYEIIDYVDFNSNGICDNLETFCTDFYACNYNPFATPEQTDASCTYPGCNDPAADNYSPFAACNDGSCTYFQGGLYIPDNQGCFYMSDFINIPGNPFVQDLYDVAEISINIEHSFIGDLIINVICPNGQVMNILPAEAGSGTYLGEPIDIDDGVPGVGYTYTFSPYSSGGSWVEYLNGGGASPIPAGDYAPEGTFADFIGCPLNGQWQLEICDVVGADDGWVFDFSINLSYAGCTDETACNFEPSAYYEDGSCIYPGCTDPSAINYEYWAGCDDGSCEYNGDNGCTDIYACNYNPIAISDDGSCTYPGCVYFYACNYNDWAGCDDGSCTYPGCTDPSALNYDYSAGCDDGSCYYNIFGCTDNYACNWNPDANVNDGSCTYPGCTDFYADNYNPYAGCEDGSCYYTYYGCTDYYACNWNPDANVNDGSCTYPGCTDFYADNYNPYAGCEDGSCYYTYYGCTDYSACNWNQNANVNDGSCTYPGCTDYYAVNYNEFAGCENGSCNYYSFGCTDFNACNYDMNASYDDGNCSYPGCVDPGALNYEWYAGCADNSCYYDYTYGCTDIIACNYNLYAYIDDGTCSYPGCTDGSAINFLWYAGCDDGSCYYSYDFGCTDYFTPACNYNPYAFYDDGSCIYPGCTDPYAANYNMYAGCDDGSCYSYIYGCGDAYACNYNPNVQYDDGSCSYPGCTDPNALNYSNYAGCSDYSCEYYNYGCTDGYACNYDYYANYNDGSCTYPGCMDYYALNYNEWAGCDDGNCLYAGCTDYYACNWNSIADYNDGSCTYPGCTDFSADNYNPYAGCESGTCYYSYYGCTDFYACNYVSDATVEDGSCTYPGCTDSAADNYNPYAGCENGSCNYNTVYGCTDSYACNWNPDATVNDASCTYPGCTDPLAINFNDFAGCDDGTCYYSEIFGCTDSYACNWNPDATVNDASCTYPGCTDPMAMNYDYYAGCDDGSCYYPVFYGCTAIEACNFDVYADVDDGSCQYPGCTDPLALNYDSTAGCVDYSCVYQGFCGNPQLLFDEGPCVANENGIGAEVTLTFAFEGECTVATVTINGEVIDVSDEDLIANSQFSFVLDPFTATVWSYSLGNGVASETYIFSAGLCTEYFGCTDISACNFIDMATIDDGSCTYPGCADPSAINFESDAGCSDYSCYYSYDYGCMDFTACNYNPYAMYNDYCSYPGCTNFMATNYDFDAGCDDGSCVYSGCDDSNACNYSDYANSNDGSCLYPGCIDSAASNYNPAAGCTDFSCTYTGGCSNPALIIQEGNCVYNENSFGPELLVTFSFQGTCSVATVTINGQEIDVTNENYTANSQETVVLPPNYTSTWFFTLGNGLSSEPYTFTTADCSPVFGCTDAAACNFDALSNLDNGSCEYPGCLDINACSYNPLAGCTDEGMCTYPGSPCDDNNVNTQNDVLNQFCSCVSCAFAAPEIIGDFGVSPGSTQVYSVGSLSGVNYVWEVTGGNITAGQGTNAVTVSWSAAGNFTLSITLLAGDGSCSQTDAVNVVVVGVAEWDSDEMNLFPNPAKDLLNISYHGSKPDHIEVINLLGEQLYTGPFKSQLDVTGLANGMYVLRIWNNSESQTRRFEVQR